MKVEGLFGKMVAQLVLRKEEFKSEPDEEEAAVKEADALFRVIQMGIRIRR